MQATTRKKKEVEKKFVGKYSNHLLLQMVQQSISGVSGCQSKTLSSLPPE
jgi:hypothetical protein